MEVKDTPNLGNVPDDVEHSARIFTLGIPRLAHLVDELSLKSARRVLKALVEFPLQDDKKELLVHDEEKNAFALALELMDARSRMIEYSFKEREKKEAEKTEEKKEETDGKIS